MPPPEGVPQSGLADGNEREKRVQVLLSPVARDVERPTYDVKRYEPNYPRAVTCLTKDEDVLFTFYDFPTVHWLHIRTTNAIESNLATVRHRTRQTKGCGSRAATLMMVFTLALEAEKKWRRLNGHALIAKVIDGVRFADGEPIEGVKLGDGQQIEDSVAA